MTPLLDIRHLGVRFDRAATPITAVDDVSFRIWRGETIALVGESGCGKTLTARAVPGLLPTGASLDTRSRITFDGIELTTLPERELRAYRGARIAMVFQDPGASLNPVLRIGEQLAEAIRAHRPVPRRVARERAIALLGEVGIGDPAHRIDAWPHQLSGGMQQRAMIAIALAGEPDLLVADEPTTALDVTVQAQILELLDGLRRSRGMALLLVTHDLAIVAGRADRVLVMYAGRIVESGPTRDLFHRPRHPYTRGLLASLPVMDAAGGRLQAIPGAVPAPERWPTGCRFHPRCPLAIDRCPVEAPSLEALGSDHAAACWVTAPAGAP